MMQKTEMMLSPDETEDKEPASKKKKPETALSFLLVRMKTQEEKRKK